MSKDRSSPRPAAYHLMSVAEKQASSLSAVREMPVACPRCDTQLLPDDLLNHLEQRCAGPREPGHGSRWINWREATSLVPERTLKRWVQAKHVRFKGGRGDRLYLRRDLVKRIALRRIVSRR